MKSKRNYSIVLALILSTFLSSGVFAEEMIPANYERTDNNIFSVQSEEDETSEFSISSVDDNLGISYNELPIDGTETWGKTKKEYNGKIYGSITNSM